MFHNLTGLFILFHQLFIGRHILQAVRCRPKRDQLGHGSESNQEATWDVGIMEAVSVWLSDVDPLRVWDEMLLCRLWCVGGSGNSTSLTLHRRHSCTPMVHHHLVLVVLLGEKIIRSLVSHTDLSFVDQAAKFLGLQGAFPSPEDVLPWQPCPKVRGLASGRPVLKTDPSQPGWPRNFVKFGGIWGDKPW